MAAITDVAQLSSYMDSRWAVQYSESATAYTRYSPAVFTSMWLNEGETTGPGAGTGSEAPTSAHAYAIEFSNAGTGNLWLTSANFTMWTFSDGGKNPPASVSNPGTTNIGGCLVLIDRVAHQSGLAGNSNSVQTTNLPTTTLTRYTDGVGVMAALEVYTDVGSTATTASVSYTNQAGTSGRTAFCGFGAGNRRRRGAFIPLSLQSGDTGIRSVESVTLAASTGTLGDFGVTLFKPLALFPVCWYGDNHVYQALDGLFPIEIKDDSCLSFLNVMNRESTTGGSSGHYTMLGFMEV